MEPGSREGSGLHPCDASAAVRRSVRVCDDPSARAATRPRSVRHRTWGERRAGRCRTPLVRPVRTHREERPVGDHVRATVDEERALRVAWREHGPELLATAARRLGDRHLAEEVVADAFYRAWRAGHDPSRGSMRTFLFAILRNGVVDAARHRGARPASPVADAPDQEVVGDEGDAVDARLQLREALRHLSDPHREVIVECHLRDRPYEEVAAQLDVPVSTLRTRMYYGLRALRLALEEQGWTDGR